MKDQFFNEGKVRYLADLFARAVPEFDASEFQARVMARLPELELKARLNWIAECLGETLPGGLDRVGPAILAALPEPLDPDLTDNDFGDFIFAPLGEWVARIGQEDPQRSLDLIEALTQRFSMEFAVRPFLNRSPEAVLERMRGWCGHESYHVRRLVSEGTRPRLPWGSGIGLTAEETLPLLDQLHADGTRFVTRSVANHLNDIARSDPGAVLARLQQWRAEGRQRPEELRWMTGHSLRGLVKAGHPGALKMLGYDPEAELSVDLAVTAPARIGGALEFRAKLTAPQPLPVLVDYIVHFRRPGGRISAKVHKLKQAAITGKPLVLTKVHRLKGDATTFTLVPGAHRLELQVNGKVRAAVDFELLG